MRKGLLVVSAILVLLGGVFSHTLAADGGMGVGLKEYVGIINFPHSETGSAQVLGGSFYFLPSLNLKNRFNPNISLDVDLPVFDTLYWAVNKRTFVARGYDFMATANIPGIFPSDDIVPSFGLGLGLKLDYFADQTEQLGIGLSIPISGGAEYFINPQFSVLFTVKSGFDFGIIPNDASLWYGIVGGVGVSFFL